MPLVRRLLASTSVCLVGAVTFLAATPRQEAPDAAAKGITAVAGIRVGQVTLSTRPTGCTVVLTPPNTVGAVDERGGAPGTVETDLLRPENTVAVVNAIVLSGGSAFGLDTRTGVVKYLAEQHVGYPAGGTVVPIVPGAIIFDLNIGGHPEIHPDAACGYDAARQASAGAIEEGSVGAGAGATVGKSNGGGHAMKGGVGTSSIQMPNGLIVGAIVVVNAVGSVYDWRTAKMVAGVRAADGKTLEDPLVLLLHGGVSAPRLLENTTIGDVATNAKLTKSESIKVAQKAHDGIARAILPSHLPSDGDTLFSLATGSFAQPADVGQIGSLAAEAVSEAIVRAVRLAKGLPGYPSVSDIR